MDDCLSGQWSSRIVFDDTRVDYNITLWIVIVSYELKRYRKLPGLAPKLCVATSILPIANLGIVDSLLPWAVFHYIFASELLFVPVVSFVHVSRSAQWTLYLRTPTASHCLLRSLGVLQVNHRLQFLRARSWCGVTTHHPAIHVVVCLSVLGRENLNTRAHYRPQYSILPQGPSSRAYLSVVLYY